MTTRYQEKHYEDVARIVRLERTYWAGLVDDAQAAVAESVLSRWTRSLADIFAADNPPTCDFGYYPHTGSCPKWGFDRERFLAACRLEPEPARPYSTSMLVEQEECANEEIYTPEQEAALAEEGQHEEETYFPSEDDERR